MNPETGNADQDRSWASRFLGRLGFGKTVEPVETHIGLARISDPAPDELVGDTDVPPLDWYTEGMEPVRTNFTRDPNRPLSAHEEAAVQEAMAAAKAPRRAGVPPLLKSTASREHSVADPIGFVADRDPAQAAAMQDKRDDLVRARVLSDDQRNRLL